MLGPLCGLGSIALVRVSGAETESPVESEDGVVESFTSEKKSGRHNNSLQVGILTKNSESVRDQRRKSFHEIFVRKGHLLSNGHCAPLLT